tara:strand:+ start:215 stop:571 length:357 start_codon:yes stop_codon:yes gene_type:complete
MKITLLAHHIEWDTDGTVHIQNGNTLPSKMEVEVDLDDITHGVNINDIICDQLSDATGWCVLDYKLQGYSAEADFALQMSNAPQQNETDEFHKTCEEAEEEMAAEADDYNPEGEWFSK